MNKKTKFFIVVIATIISIILISFSNSTGLYFSFIITMPIVGMLFFNVYKKASYTEAYKLFILIYLVNLIALLIERKSVVNFISVLPSAFVISGIHFILALIGMVIAHLILSFRSGENIYKKVIVILVIVLLVSPIAFFSNAFNGNPISKMLANSNADKYVKEKYGNLDVKRDETYFEFKTSKYVVKYQSDKLKDLNFEVHCRLNGKVSYDTYEEDVLNNFSTFTRLDSELREKIYKENIDGDIVKTKFFFILDEKETILKELVPEMTLKEAIEKFGVYASITYNMEDLDFEKMRGDLITIYDKYKNEYKIKSINLEILRGEKAEKGSFIFDINPEILKKDDAADRLKKMYEENKIVN